jgi:hypothetical protein
MKNLLRMVLILALMAVVDSAHAFGQAKGEASQKLDGVSARQNANSLTGKVAETMNTGGYTYINIEKDNKKIWVAVPQSDVKVGQEISVTPGVTMSNFESKSLNRTFESIVFSPALVTGGTASTVSAPQSSSTPVKFAEEKVKVEKASGPDAYTVAELYNKKTSLEKKNVVVRGKVVKVSTGIMNTNWIHIQDGSGDASSGTNDLLVTTDDLPSVGDTVTANGTLVKDKDIGSGYKFVVMVEQAKIKK